MPDHQNSYAVAAIQVLFGALALAIVVMAPPAQGLMLILPLTSAARPVVTAIQAGGALIAPGPIYGSIIVRGNRNLIVPASLEDGSVVVSTNERGCAEPGVS